MQNLRPSTYQKHISEWGKDEIDEWMKVVGLGDYCAVFAENHITGKNLFEVKEGDLREFGFKSLGHRKTFIKSAF